MLSEIRSPDLPSFSANQVFQDIGEEYLVEQDFITRGRFLGKGAFGAVYAGIMIDKVCVKPVQ